MNERARPELPRLPLPGAAGRPIDWGQLHGAAPALALAEAARHCRGLALVVTPDTPTATRLRHELAFFAGELPVMPFPDWETLPYDVFSPHQDIVSTRLLSLYRLREQGEGILVVPAATLMQRIAPRAWLDSHCLVLSKGDRLDLDGFRRRLEAAGHRCMPQVREHGEFAIRGSLLDLFPMGSAEPYRIDLFDEEVESIRTFDPETQISSGRTDTIRLLPAREFPLEESAIARFRQSFRVQFPNSADRSPLYKDVSAGLTPGGIEYYLPLFFERTETLFEYLPPSCTCFAMEEVGAAARSFSEQTLQRYEQRRHDVERPLLPPDALFLSPEEVMQALERRPLLRLQREPVESGRGNFPSRPAPALEFHQRADEPALALKTFLDEFEGRVLFVAESAGRRELMLEHLQTHGILLPTVDGWQEFLVGPDDQALATAALEQGLILDEPSIAIVVEEQLEGERVRQRHKRSGRRDLENIVSNLDELELGAPVVHEEHGVGRYRGLEILDAGGLRSEFLVLEYDGGGRLYVPVADLGLIRRYTGARDETAPWHRLGSEQWQKAKRKAAQRVRDVAAELLDIYARRMAGRGHAFEIDGEAYRRFAEAFPFEETPDQASAIESTIADMRSAQAMDRVICGDVGFGKTEVALRATFLAVHSGHQVAVLVPTTLLAQQHYRNFIDRFADWPVNIEVLSRFRTRKEQNAVIERLSGGRVDIVIGTHKLLQSGIEFKRLGLLIVDEEHRFGVRHKERLKALRSEVDILTLTATPIPRTLNMSLAGIRDLSIIATPPAERLAITTQVAEWSSTLVQEACLRELKRGGQVYLLHNEVQSIERKAREIERIVPEARIGIAHGQMPERELEQVMLDFYHQRCNILVCSTIIESGIDVPNANTIIINRADKLGLAQIHQLRGRVGRSHHRAYAYLAVPHRGAMTADARKRIEAIESMEDLGAGFFLATHDLEIRGAGELLGEEQSGQIHEIGFSLYNELLERAVTALKTGREPALEQPMAQGPEIDLQVAALLPDDYLPDVHTRLILYKRIASADSVEKLHELQVEMVDRFGLLPEAAKNLFRVTELKIRTGTLGVRRVEAGPTSGRIHFEPEPQINFERVLHLIREHGDVYRLDGNDRLRFEVQMPDLASRVETVDKLLTELAA